MIKDLISASTFGSSGGAMSSGLRVVNARHCACVLSWSPSKGRAWLYGRQSGVLIAEYLLDVLTREVEQARDRYDEDLPMMIGESQRRMAWHHFTSSAVLAIENRLKSLREEETGAHPDQAALVHRRDVELRDWLDDKGMDFKKAAPDAFCFLAEGYAAGHAIALRDAVTAGTGVASPERELSSK